MYLFVYIFLLLSIMGLYSQLYMLQAGAEKNLQTTVAQTMHQWHASAHRLAEEVTISPAAGASCSLTSPDAVVPCTHVLQDPAGPIPAGPPAYPDYHLLPMGYNYNQKFRSLAYNLGSKRYVITFIEANATALGLKAGEVYTQIQRTKIPAAIYGQVSAGTCDGVVGQVLFTNEYIQPTVGALYRLCYPVPATVPTGSVAFVSLL